MRWTNSAINFTSSNAESLLAFLPAFQQACRQYFRKRKIDEKPKEAHVDNAMVLKELASKPVELQWNIDHPIVLAVVSEKGGVGKTALTTGLAAVMAYHDKRVLVIDMDARATATEELGIRQPEFTVNDLLYTDVTAEPTPVVGIAEQALTPAGDGWPATVDVIAAERALAHREADTTSGLEHRLEFALRGVADKYDLVIIDVPPRAGGRLVGTALIAATHVVLPATLDEDGYVGVRDALKTIKRTQLGTNPNLTVVGIVRNIVDRRRTSLAAHYDTQLHEEMGELLLEDVAIAKYVIRQESRAACVPITAAHSSEAQTIINGYTQVLNRVAKAA